MLEQNRVRLANSLSWAMLGVGIASLVIAVLYSSSVLAFIGLGLTFWGAVLLYIQNQEYLRDIYRSQKEPAPVKQVQSERPLDFSAAPTLATLSQIVEDLDCTGDAAYLPPAYFRTVDTVKVYVSRQKGTRLPTEQLIQKNENRAFVRRAQGLLLVPPGAELARVLEEKIGASFSSMNLEDVEMKLPTLLVEDLRIVESLKIQTVGREVRRKITPNISLVQTKEDVICAEITNSIYRNIYADPQKFLIISMIGAADVSAIAIAITKASCKPIRIENIEIAQDGRTLRCYYKPLEEE